MVQGHSRSAPSASSDIPQTADALVSQLGLLGNEEKKLVFLRRHLGTFLSSSPALVADLATDGLRMAIKQQDDEAIAELLGSRGRARRRLGMLDEALTDLNEAYPLYGRLELLENRGGVAAVIGACHSDRGDVASAVTWYRRAVGLYEEGEIETGLPRVLAALANLLTDIGDYSRALDCNQRALKLLEKEGNIAGAGIILSSIGEIHAALNQNDAARDCFQRSVENFRISGNRYHEIRGLTNLGHIHFARGEDDKALEHLRICLGVYDAMHDKQGAASALMTIGLINERHGDAPDGLNCQIRALELLEKLPEEGAHVSALMNIGRMRVSMGEYRSGCEALQDALAMAERIGARAVAADLHALLAQSYEDAGDLQNALDHQREYARRREDLLELDRRREINLVQTRFNVESGDHAGERLRQRIAELEIELQERGHEVAMLALNAVERTQMIETIRRVVADIVRRCDSSLLPLMADLLAAVGGHDDGPDSWSAFETSFQLVNHDFLQNLSQRHPQLTPTELKICALLKISMPTKEVARVLHMSQRTVESHRYWIRKKLTLTGRTSLNTYLSGL